jgi:DNA-binding IscR family transcriptional regulator
MKSNSRLSDVLHVLLHMAEGDGSATSEALATAMNTNPVVLRRLMAGLRDAGFVVSEKGHGGGWVLSCALDRITLGDVYQALGAPKLVSLGFREDNPSCLVAQAVNEALADAAREAEALLLKRLGTVTLATLSADFHDRLSRHSARHGHTHTHQLKDHTHESI